MFSSSDQWAKLLRARVFKKNGVVSYHISSSIWPGLKSLLSTVQHHSSWQIGNGLNINFWTDCWLEKPVTDILNIPAELHGNLKTKVSHFLRNGSCQIPNSLLQHFLVLCNDWLNITVPNDPVPDKRVWSYSSSGQLSLKDAYMFLFLAGNSLSCFKSIWKSCIPPSKSMLLWRLMHNKVATDENLRIRGCTVVSICSLCNTAVESSQHLFFDCAFATDLELVGLYSGIEAEPFFFELHPIYMLWNLLKASFSCSFSSCHLCLLGYLAL